MIAHNSKGKIAITHYELLEVFGGGTASIIQCKLSTGRTHQIRVHMNHIGHSIIGDQIYGNNKRKAKPFNNQIIDGFSRQALHAEILKFIHPNTGQAMSFNVPPPEDIQQLIIELRKL
jgi:23S rRNA pseudouridine1911/1915/1917 synthase